MALRREGGTRQLLIESVDDALPGFAGAVGGGAACAAGADGVADAAGVVGAAGAAAVTSGLGPGFGSNAADGLGSIAADGLASSAGLPEASSDGRGRGNGGMVARIAEPVAERAAAGGAGALDSGGGP